MVKGKVLAQKGEEQAGTLADVGRDPNTAMQKAGPMRSSPGASDHVTPLHVRETTYPHFFCSKPPTVAIENRPWDNLQPEG